MDCGEALVPGCEQGCLHRVQRARSSAFTLRTLSPAVTCAQLESLVLPSTARGKKDCCIEMLLTSLAMCVSHPLMPPFCTTRWPGHQCRLMRSNEARPPCSTPGSRSIPLLPLLVPLHLGEDSFLRAATLGKGREESRLVEQTCP